MLRAKQRGSKSGRDGMQTRKMATTRPGHSGETGSVCSQAGYVSEVSRQPAWRTQKQRACHGLTERSGYRSLRLEQVQDEAQDKGIGLRGLVMDIPGTADALLQGCCHSCKIKNKNSQRNRHIHTQRTLDPIGQTENPGDLGSTGCLLV